jgi:ABC-type transport system involved in multi-copper enzyme maturation permease subunit
MFNFYYVAKNTYRESIREPIFFILLMFSLILIGIFPGATLFVFREQMKLVIDSSMATTLVFVLVTAVLCAGHTVTREMHNGTVLLLMSKPVHRWSFIVAKILGIMAALMVFVFICNCATMIAVGVSEDQFWINLPGFYSYFAALTVCSIIGIAANFFQGKSFSAVAINALLIVIPIFSVIFLLLVHKNLEDVNIMQVIMALILIFFAVAAMGTITVVFSTRIDMVANLCLCSIIFFLGLISSYMFNREFDSAFLTIASKCFYAVLPNWQFFWLADALAANQAIPWSYIAWSGVYVVLYMLFCSLWAVILFQNRELAIDVRQ